MKIISDRLRKVVSKDYPLGRWMRVDQLVEPTKRTNSGKRKSKPGKNQHG